MAGNVNCLVGMVMVTAGVSRYGVTVGTNIKPGASHRDPAIRPGMGQQKEKEDEDDEEA